MPEAILSPEQWDAVKAASIKGVPDSQLAESFGINGNAIRQRRFLDPVWKAAVQATRESRTNKADDLTPTLTEGQKTADSASLAQKVASTVSENIASIATANNLLALQIAQKGLQKANLAPPDVRSWSDVEILTKITQKAAGLEGGNAVQVNILNDAACSVEHGDFPVFEAE